MKAVVYNGPGKVKLEEKPKPEPKVDNILIEVIYCSICGTDLKLATIGNPRFNPPSIIGHELVGKIIHVGEKIDGFDIGEKITMATTIACGDCYYCLINKGNICPDVQAISNHLDGAFTKYMEIPSIAIENGNVIKVPDNVPDEYAALSEPLSCAINGQELAGVKKGDRVMIIGGGPLGAIHAELAKALGASEVIISEISKDRIDLLSRLSDITIINSLEEDTEKIIKDKTKGIGVDVVIVCAPALKAHQESIKYVRKGGTINFFASLPRGSSEICFDSRTIHYGEIKIIGVSDSRPEHVKKAVKLMADRDIDLSSIITHKILLTDFHKGIELMKNKKSLKVLVYPDNKKI